LLPRRSRACAASRTTSLARSKQRGGRQGQIRTLQGSD
jgi:hypothetical protein